MKIKERYTLIVFILLSNYTLCQIPLENQGQKNAGVNSEVNKNDSIQVKSKQNPIYGAEIMPQFPGGEEALFRFINEHLKYPIEAAEKGISGIVNIRFVVEATGEITEVEVFRSLDPYCDKEAIRVIKLMPKWVPGVIDGKKARTYFLLPIRYKLSH